MWGMTSSGMTSYIGTADHSHATHFVISTTDWRAKCGVHIAEARRCDDALVAAAVTCRRCHRGGLPL